MFMVLWCPSVVVAGLRPKRLVRRLLSGLPEKFDDIAGDDDGGGVTMNDDHQDQQGGADASGIGGGRINEKIRTYTGPSTGNETGIVTSGTTTSQYNPSQTHSHLLHALEGLDRYPNYLARWNDEDIDRLEESLEEKLAIVRHQREATRERKLFSNSLVQTLLSEHKEKDRWKTFLEPCETWEDVRKRILHPKAAKAIFSSKMFQEKRNNNHTVPSVEDVLNGQCQVELDPGRLEALLDEELYDVYSFRLLSDDFCDNIREFVKELAVLSESATGAELYKNRPFNLDMIGLSWINDLLFHLVMKPIARQLFFESEGLQQDLDWRNGYIAGYSAKPGTGKPRERLVTHTDDAECTRTLLCL